MTETPRNRVSQVIFRLGNQLLQKLGFYQSPQTETGFLKLSFD